MTDFRALCAEMANELDHYYIGIQGHDRSHPLAVEARAALAQPEPEPEVDDILRLAAIIREVNGGKKLGAAALAEAILSHRDSCWGRTAQPESQRPTDEYVVAACPFDSFHEPAEYHGWWSAIEWMEQRWGRPAVEPVPVSERPWERKGWCNAHQRCWVWNEGNCRWWEFIDSRMISFSHDDYTHCLPYWALPTGRCRCLISTQIHKENDD